MGSFFSIYLYQGQVKVETIWYQTNIVDILSSFGGTITTILGTVTFFISGYQSFVADKSLIKKLYGQIDMTQEGEDDTGGQKDENEPSVEAVFKAKLEERQDF